MHRGKKTCSTFNTHIHLLFISCPNRPAICDWSAFSSFTPNPQLLIGALVGGPDAYDYVKNEVTTDNAGFQSAVAALLHGKLRA